MPAGNRDRRASGILVPLPRWAGPFGGSASPASGRTSTIPVRFEGTTTHRVQTVNVTPTPKAAALWARGGGHALTIEGSGIQVRGWAHSDGGVIDAWRPGGEPARSYGTAYTAVPASSCADGTWRPRPADLTGAVVYVPCADFSIASGEAIDVTGSGFLAVRPLWAGGAVGLEADASTLSCGVYGGTILVTGSGTKIGACTWGSEPD